MRTRHLKRLLEEIKSQEGVKNEANARGDQIGARRAENEIKRLRKEMKELEDS